MSSGDSSTHLCSNGQTSKSKKHLNNFENGIITHQKDVVSLKLHKSPITTMYYAIMESLYLLFTFIRYVLSHKKIIIILFLAVSSLASVNLIEGAHQKIIREAFRKTQWWIWWIFLGFLSSCGFGSGLHTFVLYLGPFIARVTMAAYECGTVDFREPPYPNEFICPSSSGKKEMSAFIIVHKVLLESILWGFGTAVGELPPYFMARAAALTGSINKESSPEDHSPWHARAQDVMRVIVSRIGFVGIMLCASVPNPLFDLAGMTCGHFMVPFSTFFGATVLGKAVNKMMIQLAFVVIIFSKDKVLWIQSCVKDIPRYGGALNSLIDEFLAQQKEKIHSSIVSDKQGWLQLVFSYFQLMIIVGFLVSIVHSLAANYASRLRLWQLSYDDCIDPAKIKSH